MKRNCCFAVAIALSEDIRARVERAKTTQKITNVPTIVTSVHRTPFIISPQPLATRRISQCFLHDMDDMAVNRTKAQEAQVNHRCMFMHQWYFALLNNVVFSFRMEHPNYER